MALACSLCWEQGLLELRPPDTFKNRRTRIGECEGQGKGGEEASQKDHPAGRLSFSGWALQTELGALAFWGALPYRALPEAEFSDFFTCSSPRRGKPVTPPCHTSYTWRLSLQLLPGCLLQPSHCVKKPGAWKGQSDACLFQPQRSPSVLEGSGEGVGVGLFLIFPQADFWKTPVHQSTFFFPKDTRVLALPVFTGL